uniref:Raftlin family member 2 n=1 Tax=Cercocebus atys TaxID=9531 RepID=A0A2K5LQR5_CERAT
MGCGLRKLEDPDDSSPGKIFSTLKRPQVETKTEFAYEYVLLDFTLQEVIKINSILCVCVCVCVCYLKGYIVGAILCVCVCVCVCKHLPASYLYRVVLSRLKLSPKNSAAPSGQRRPRLVVCVCVCVCVSQTNDTAKELIVCVCVCVCHYSPSKFCNGANHDGDIESIVCVCVCVCVYCRSWNEGTLKLHHESGHYHVCVCVCVCVSKSRKEEASDNKLYTVFNVFDDSTSLAVCVCVCVCVLTRKGSVISTLVCVCVCVCVFYYKQGLSLIDVWEHLPKSLEGFFIYEEEGSGDPGSSRKGNDAIVVEQWTVIEGCEIKTDYGPLLHTLAEFGWLLTSVLPTPVLRHDSEGNLATKQIVFLQRPVMWNSAAQTPDKKASRHIKGEDKNKATSRSIGLDTTTSQPAESRHPPEECRLSPSRECWTREGTLAQHNSFSGFSSSDSVLRELDDGQFDQEDGVTQVTCM